MILTASEQRSKPTWLYSVPLVNACCFCFKYTHSDHYGYGLSQWKTMLHFEWNFLCSLINFIWNMFLMIYLTISQDWFRQWLSAWMAISLYLNHCWLRYMTANGFTRRQWVANQIAFTYCLRERLLIIFRVCLCTCQAKPQVVDTSNKYDTFSSSYTLSQTSKSAFIWPMYHTNIYTSHNWCDPQYNMYRTLNVARNVFVKISEWVCEWQMFEVHFRGWYLLHKRQGELWVCILWRFGRKLTAL